MSKRVFKTELDAVNNSLQVQVNNSISKNIVDAKGDIVTASAADTPIRLAVGTNEHRLVADSATTSGLKYVADTTNYAVGAKGDLLAGTAADTVSALTVGANGETLVADSSTSTGLKWSPYSSIFAWTAYTPTYTNFTLGNGTVDARYAIIGKTVFVRCFITLGSTSTVSSYPFISFPVTANKWGYYAGTVTLTDAGTTQYVGNLYLNDNAKGWWSVTKTDGTYAVVGVPDATIPFTWGNGDNVYIEFNYEAA